MARFRIVLFSRRTDEFRNLSPPGSFWRVKSTAAAFLVVSALIGLLLAALLLGSIIAALLIILVMVSFAVVTVRAAIFRTWR